MKDLNSLYENCIKKAAYLLDKNLLIGQEHMDLFQVADLLFKLETEKLEKDTKSDLKLNYTDEIISIEDVGIKETIDISVSGDNLFYCNGILTKNSFGLPATLDFMVGLIRTEELDKINQLMIKQLKSRYNDVNYYNRFIIGVDIRKFKLHDVEESQQKTISDQGKTDDDISLFDKSMKFKRDFSSINVD